VTRAAKFPPRGDDISIFSKLDPYPQSRDPEAHCPAGGAPLTFWDRGKG